MARGMNASSGPGLALLLARIEAAARSDGHWRLAAEEVIAALGLDATRFWRTVHPLRDRIDFVEAVDGFCQDTVGDLVTVLEGLGLEEAEEALTRAGYFLPHPLRAELMEELLSTARRRAFAQEIQEEEFASMLRSARGVPAAISLYLGQHTDLEALLEDCAESFRLSRGISSIGARTAARYLSTLLSRHIVEPRALFAALEARLRLAAALLGYVDAEESAEEGRRERREPAGRSGRIDWALRVMGIPSGRISRMELRMRYRQLIMQYHPDVNPAGLERCKDVTAAYSLLISEED